MSEDPSRLVQGCSSTKQQCSTTMTSSGVATCDLDALNNEFGIMNLFNGTNYETVRKSDRELYEDLNKKYEEIVRSCLNYVPAAHEHKGNVEVITYVVTINELFGHIKNATKHASEEIPRDILDKLQDYLPKIEEVRKNGYVELSKFVDIFDLRDKILDHMRVIYRSKKHIPTHSKKDDNGKKIGNAESDHREELLDHFKFCSRTYENLRYQSLNCDRYCPYDYNWACGSKFTGPEQALCLKYLCATRMFQMDLLYIRMANCAALFGIDEECKGSVFLPISEDIVNAELLDRHLQVRENVLNDRNERVCKKLRLSARNKPDHRFTSFIHFMADIHQLLCDGKQELIRKMVDLNTSDCIATHSLVAALATVETMVLLLQKTYALFVDKTFGMFGVHVPDEVVNMIWTIVRTVNKGIAPTNLLNSFIELMLTNLKAATRTAIENFHVIHEESCEMLNKNKLIRNEIDSEGSTHEMKIDDFQELGADHCNRMKTNLFWEKTEIKRLDAQLIKIKNAYKLWLLKEPGDPELSTYIITGKIVAIVSNADDILSHHMINPIGKQTPRFARSYKAGSDIKQIIHSIMAQDKTTPNIIDFIEKMKTTFQAIFGDMEIDGCNAEKYSDTITMIALVGVAEDEQILMSERTSASLKTATKMAKKIGKYLLNYITKKDKEEKAQELLEIKQRHELNLRVARMCLMKAFGPNNLAMRSGDQPGPSSSSS